MDLAELDLRKYLGESPAEKVLKIPERKELQVYIASSLVADIKRDIEKGTTGSTSEILQTLSDIEGRIEIARSERELCPAMYNFNRYLFIPALLYCRLPDSGNEPTNTPSAPKP